MSESIFCDFEEGDKVFAFGEEDDEGVIVRESESAGKFLVRFEDGEEVELDGENLCLVGS